MCVWSICYCMRCQGSTCRYASSTRAYVKTAPIDDWRHGLYLLSLGLYRVFHVGVRLFNDGWKNKMSTACVWCVGWSERPPSSLASSGSVDPVPRPRLKQKHNRYLGAQSPCKVCPPMPRVGLRSSKTIKAVDEPHKSTLVCPSRCSIVAAH